MPENDETLLELAFKSEKYGDRKEAIRLYREVADGGSEHATYARNCAENLEQIGLSTAPMPQEPGSPSASNDTPKSNNPFESPSFGDPQHSATKTSFAIIHRIQITATIARAISVFCVLAGAFSFWMITILYGNFTRLNSTRLRVSASLDGLMGITLMAVAWLCWRHSTALQQLLPVSHNRIDTYSKQQLWLWIGIGTLAILRIVRELTFFLPT